MRLVFTAIFVTLIVFLMVFAMVPSGAIYPISTGNAYPVTVWSGTGTITGHVVSSSNTSYGIANCYIAIVNASNPGQGYYNTTTDMNGNFHIAGITPTYSSNLTEGPDGTTGSYSAGVSMYEIYAFSYDYNSGNFSAPFGVNVNATGPMTIPIYLPGSLSYINFTANPYLDTTGGMYSANLTAYVYDSTGKPAADGTVVNFALNVLDWSYLNGSLNGNNSQYASVPTSGGMASVHYGWFPGNLVPKSYVAINATLQNDFSVNTTLYVSFVGPAEVITSPAPSPSPTAVPSSSPTTAPVITPSPTIAPTQAPTATPTSTPTPLSPIIALLSIVACAAILIAVRKK
jgi:hypothetical protein